MNHMLANGFWALRLPLLAFYNHIVSEYAGPTVDVDGPMDYADFVEAAKRYFKVRAGCRHFFESSYLAIRRAEENDTCDEVSSLADE